MSETPIERFRSEHGKLKRPLADGQS